VRAAVKVLLAALRSTLTAEAEGWVFWARGRSGDSGIGLVSVLSEAIPDMARDDFSPKVKAALAKRAAFLCSICGASTVGPSRESPEAFTNIGVSAHIAGASQGSARYDSAMTAEQRKSIRNAIWLCQTHAKAIDDDVVTWPVKRLHRVKADHEARMLLEIGVPRAVTDLTVMNPPEPGRTITAYGFLRVRDMVPAYRAFLQPILDDKKLSEDSQLGALMWLLPTARGSRGARAPWTIFVKPACLRRVAAGGSRTAFSGGEIPPGAIFGRVPGWPDEFFEFLAAVVQTGSVFRWQRTPQGYLALTQ